MLSRTGPVSRLSILRTAISGIALAGTATLALAAGFPNVDNPGKTVARFDDGKNLIVVGYRHASGHHDGPFVVVEAALSRHREDAKFTPEHFALIAPDGTRMPLAKQKRIVEGIPKLQMVLEELKVSADPILGYFVGKNRRNTIPFFRNPLSKGVVQDEFSVDPMTVASGYLFFESPKGTFPPGIYTLEVKSKSVDAKIPLELVTEAERKGR